MEKVAGKLLGFLDDEAYLGLKDTCRFFRWHLSINSTRSLSRLLSKIEEQKKELQRFSNIHRELGSVETDF